MHHPQCLRLFATLRLRGRLGRDGCQSALWDCFGGQIWRHNENASPKRSHNALDHHLDPVSRATSKWRIVALCYFPPRWWHEVHIFPTLTPVAQVAITVCIFPRKPAPVARFTALNNLPLHHGSPGIEPCYKFPCASNRLHIAQWHWAHVFCFVLYYWAARKGNVQSRISFHLCRGKTKWRTELPEGFAYPPPRSPPLLWGRFLQGGDGLSQVVWRTDLEVDLTRTQNYCVELLALYLRRTIIEIPYLDEVVNQRGSCRNNALPQSSQEKL